MVSVDVKYVSLEAMGSSSVDESKVWSTLCLARCWTELQVIQSGNYFNLSLTPRFENQPQNSNYNRKLLRCKNTVLI